MLYKYTKISLAASVLSSCCSSSEACSKALHKTILQGGDLV